MVKRAASDCLAKYGIHKANADFKEIWGFVYRGTEFALVRLSPLFMDMDNTGKPCAQRGQMQSRAIESRAAEKFAKVHAEMYIKRTVPVPGGFGGVQEGRNRCSSISSRSHDNAENDS